MSSMKIAHKFLVSCQNDADSEKKQSHADHDIELSEKQTLHVDGGDDEN